jgi:hypothetical protein
MTVGVYQKRKGENYEITNAKGAQIINYETTPLMQMQMASIPPSYFSTIGLLNTFIDEQGVSTSALNSIPSGVKANAAIESLKETEYANLKIATNQIKKVIRRFTERMLDIADKYFITPQDVELLESDNPVRFQVIGNTGAELMREAGMESDNLIPIKKDYKVDIEVESGMAYTYEGKKQVVGSYIDRMIQLAQAGYMSQEAVKFVVAKANDIYKIGPTSEFMEAMDKQDTNTTESDLAKMKIAIAEVIKDLDMVGPKASEDRIMENKIGVVEGLKDAGLMDKPQEIQPEKVSQSISFKDLPVSGQAQLAAKVGIQISPEEIAINQEMNKPLPVKNKK